MDGIIFGILDKSESLHFHYDFSDVELLTLMTAFPLVPKHLCASIGHLWRYISHSINFKSPTFKKKKQTKLITDYYNRVLHFSTPQLQMQNNVLTS